MGQGVENERQTIQGAERLKLAVSACVLGHPVRYNGGTSDRPCAWNFWARRSISYLCVRKSESDWARRVRPSASSVPPNLPGPWGWAMPRST